MKKIIASVIAAAMTVLGLSGVAMISPAYAVPGPTGNAADQYTNATQNQGYSNIKLMSSLQAIISTVIGLVGFIAVVMIIVGGISFITSQGDSGKVAKARNTILYGVIGLVVAILAYAIVNFVLGASIFKTA